MLTGNKGEWSEIYVLLRLLADGRIYAADEQIKRISEIYFPILKIFRHKSWQNIHDVKYEIPDNVKFIEIYLDKEYMGKFDREKLGLEAKELYEYMKQQHVSSFASDKTEDVMKKLYTDKLKAPSLDKKDISMQVHDLWTGYNPVCGFSIKSEIGSSPTLLNSSKQTNFRYKINGLVDNDIAAFNGINSKKKVKERMEFLKNKNAVVQFSGLTSDSFQRNLMMIDSLFPKIMGEALYYYFFENCKTCKELVNKLEENDPMQYNTSGLYEYKFKSFLRSVALGMVPSKKWNGKDDANGGYIIVREDGEVLAYYIYNKDSFETYLLNSTKFETGSTSKHDFASLYKVDNDVYLNLNLAVRFI